MLTPTTNVNLARHFRSRLRRATLVALVPLAVAITACGSGQNPPGDGGGPGAAAAPSHDHGAIKDMKAEDRAAAMLATAGFQDVSTAEQAGYDSSLETLGCFQDPAKGGMGLHYIRQDLMDATLDPAEPEALVYELGLDGTPIGLVAHEYIVPVDAWTSRRPPKLFGVELHRHPTLPLWVLHTWLWKDNPNGVFADWNPAVRQCPAGVPIFGVDLPEPQPSDS
ncbi:MAG: hypothetical protein AB7L17_13840 [Ilumatobacteraceae bacterium]